MGKVSIYKSAFDKEPAHELQAEGKLLDWLMENIGGFDPLSSWHPFTVLINGVLVDQRYWPVTRIKSGDIVEVFATDPSTSWDIPKFCLHLGHELLLQEDVLDAAGNKEFHYLVQKG